MKILGFVLLVSLILVIGAGCNIFSVSPPITPATPGENGGEKLATPSFGIYHGAFPAFGPSEDVVTRDKVLDFE